MKINIINFKRVFILFLFLIISIHHLIILTVNNSILWSTLELKEINPVFENFKHLIKKKEEDKILKYYPFHGTLKKKDRYHSYFFFLKNYLYEQFPPFLIDYHNCTDLDGNPVTITFTELYPLQKPDLEIYFDEFYDFNETHIPNTIEPNVPRVIHALEPPIVRYCSLNQDCVKYFNWSIGYEEWSDIQINHGSKNLFELERNVEINSEFMMKKNQFIQKRKSDIQHQLFNDNILYSFYVRKYDDKSNEVNQLTVERYRDYDPSPLASWFCSSCFEGVTNNRNGIVREMMKSIRIDSYGDCLKSMPTNKSMDRTSENAMEKKQSIISNYKFYLSFENSNCIDYFTEKALHALNSGSVPIILGHPQILKYLPIGSYIYAGDFKNVKELVVYLKYLNSNDNEYLKYFEWRKNKDVLSKFRLANGYPGRPNSSNWICPLFHHFQKWDRGLIINKSLQPIILNNICLLNDTIKIK